jgi:lipoprotein NlpI
MKLAKLKANDLMRFSPFVWQWFRMFSFLILVNCVCSSCSYHTRKHAELAYSVGVNKYRSGDYSAAMADFNKAIEIYPKFEEAYAGRGLTELALRDFNGAKEDFDKAIQLNPQFAGGYFGRGQMKAHDSDYESAIADFDKALQLNPNYPEVYDARGLAEFDNKNFQAALNDLNKVLRLYIRYADAYYNRGQVKLALGDDVGAMADFNKAIDLNPKHSFAYVSRGCIWYGRGQLQTALDDFQMSSKLTPALFRSQYYMWLIRSQLGEKEIADEGLAKYIKLYQDPPTGWFVKIAQFLLGIVSEADFLSFANVSAPNSKEQREQLCDAYYYIGMKYFIAGDKSHGIDFLKKSIATGEAEVPEYASAVMKLQSEGIKVKGNLP